MEEVVNYGILSLIPAILAVGLAFWTKNVVLSLIISLFVGTLIIASWNPWIAMQDMFSNYLFVNITDSGNAQTIIMMSFVGGFVALLEKSGGARAFASAIARKVKSKSTAQVCGWLGGLAIFFSDSGNSLILGPIFRPIFDRLKVSRAKLAYILDSTSSPVCILVPITGWGVYIMSIIATEFENLGIEGTDVGTFVAAIPYQFYAILALILVPLIAFGKRDFGPMVQSEVVAQQGLTEEQKAAGEEVIVSEFVSPRSAKRAESIDGTPISRPMYMKIPSAPSHTCGYLNTLLLYSRFIPASSACLPSSILGNFNMAMMTPMIRVNTPKPRNGPGTSSGAGFSPPSIIVVMNIGATVVATELMAILSVMRNAPPSGEPSTITYGLATFCSITTPIATRHMQLRNTV